ncbi:MAG: LysM peptidoglycan-binding domain-containing protein [Anaerolineaceae bacterium]
MKKKIFIISISIVFSALVLSGCKMPASKAPELPDDGLMTTPIIIVTSPSGGLTGGVPSTTGTEEPGYPLEPQQPTEDFFSPTATLTPTIMVPTLTRPEEYTLRDGEFPFCIARRFDLDPTALLSLNNLSPNTLVAPGTVLKIPQTGSWGEGDRSLQPHPTTHTVRTGETIFSIACSYGSVSPEAIIAVNRLEEPYKLTAGQTLEIP